MFVRSFSLIKNKRAIGELCAILAPCRFLWEEWFDNEACPLEKGEIRLIRACLRNGNGKQPLSAFVIFNNSTRLEQTIYRLKELYPVFKDWVILKFLCRLIALEKAGKQDEFAASPPGQIHGARPALTILHDLNVISVRQLALSCKLEDLNEEAVFSKLVQFLSERQDISKNENCSK